MGRRWAPQPRAATAYAPHFTFTSIPVPQALAHLDGTLNKTEKVKLLHKFKLPDNEPRLETDIRIVDAIFFLHKHRIQQIHMGR